MSRSVNYVICAFFPFGLLLFFIIKLREREELCTVYVRVGKNWRRKKVEADPFSSFFLLLGKVWRCACLLAFSSQLGQASKSKKLPPLFMFELKNQTQAGKHFLIIVEERRPSFQQVRASNNSKSLVFGGEISRECF